jgi:hypothetical protein
MLVCARNIGPSGAENLSERFMKPVALTKGQFDGKRRELEALATDWAERECTSFDDAVRSNVNHPGVGSIWQMPAIDSKSVVSLLVEMEPLLGCKLPISLIRPGGYANAQALVAELLPAIRGRCGDDPALSQASVSVGAAAL